MKKLALKKRSLKMLMFKFLEIITYSSLLIIALLLTVMFYILWERKFIARIQNRYGPNRIGPCGILQPIADILKLLLKSQILPKKSNKFLFILSPIIVLACAITSWTFIPLGNSLLLTNLNIGILYLLAMQLISKIGTIIAGWSSNSKYALLGALRSITQIISYFIPMSLVIIGVLTRAKSMNLSLIVYAQQGGCMNWFCWPLCPLVFIYWICVMIETNRLPFDVAKSESELVSGFYVEYSGMSYALLLLTEYLNMILNAMLTVIMFFGGWLSPFNRHCSWIPNIFWLTIKTFIFMTFFLWIKGTFPRYRFDQVINLSWKVLMPLGLLSVIIQAIWIN